MCTTKTTNRNTYKYIKTVNALLVNELLIGVPKDETKKIAGGYVDVRQAGLLTKTIPVSNERMIMPTFSLLVRRPDH